MIKRCRCSIYDNKTNSNTRDPWQGLVMQASGCIVDVDIPEQSESPWPGIDIFCACMGLGRTIVKELVLKLTLGMAERAIN